ncbi:MAG: hypothetical protein COV75_03620 [Candidatus Omnitrophica bacterium CG11_big_fil_rev_8_21_14_0_20_63_9]|nr:MAG: hypothetical protein COV75_03620 [Candidatus Omnitrophica bacterium CG11_big_fil_rev_8_21_14_0_20_63_9]
MPQRQIISLATFVLVAGVLAGANTVNASDLQPDSASQRKAFARGRLLVKFKPSLTECAHCLLVQGRQFQPSLSDRSSSLDLLNRRANVLGARSVLGGRHQRSVLEARQQRQQRNQEVAAKFARRSQRRSSAEPPPDLSNLYFLEVPDDTDLEALAERYRQDPHVAYAQPDYQVTIQFTPNDPYYHSADSWNQTYDDLWGLKRMQLGPAWDVAQGEGVVVAVVDTGVDGTHPDMAMNMWANPGELPGNQVDDDSNGFIDDVNGWDFAYDDADPTDDFGHGTHVAGTIAAVGNNGVGIIGVAPRARLMAVKGLDQEGSGYISDLAAAIVYAADNGADVINNSWGCVGPCPDDEAVKDAVRYAHSQGVVVVFAAGNDHLDVSLYSPQNMTDHKPIVVGASRPDDALTSFSNFGLLTDVIAPGGGYDVGPPGFEPSRNILSLKSSQIHSAMTGGGKLVVGQRYVRQAGTSMSAPHVAGLAALVISHHPSFTNDQVRQAIRASADDVGAQGFDPITGAGRVNAAAALAIDSVLDTQILEPELGAEASQSDGPVTIRGTAAGPEFARYELLYQRDGSGMGSVTIQPSVSTPVIGGVLGTWDIGSLLDGLYTLRLLATDTAGHIFEEATQVLLEAVPARRLTTAAAHAQTPNVSGDRVVWTDFRSGDPQVYLYDLSTNTERRLSGPAGIADLPAISGDLVVWKDFVGGRLNVAVYDLTTNTRRVITPNSGTNDPSAISGNRVVWTDSRHGNREIYLYDVSTNTERRITQHSGRQEVPAISGDRIVWLDSRHGKSEVYLYDLSTNTQRRITKNNIWEAQVAIAGDYIVWTGYPADNISDIYLYDLTTNTERRITTDPGEQRDPAVWGQRIAWTDFRNGLADVYLYDMLTGTEERLTAHASRQNTPAIWQDRVVFRDARHGKGDIYLKELRTNSRPELEPVADQAATAGALLVVPVVAHDADADLVTFSAIGQPAGAGVYPRGDVSQNGAVDQADVTLVGACANGTASCSLEQRHLGDVANMAGAYQPDGQLTVHDRDAIQLLVNEHAHVSGNSSIAELGNTALVLWRPTLLQVDDMPYQLTVRATDPEGAFGEALVRIDVNAAPGAVNLIANGGFEEGKTGWSGWGTTAAPSTDTSYTGRQSARFSLGTGSSKRLSCPLVSVTAGRAYRVYASLKTASLGSKRAYVELRWKKPGGSLIRTDVIAPVTGTTDWVRNLTTVVAPAGSAKLDLTLVTDPGTGTAYFDAIRVE